MKSATLDVYDLFSFVFTTDEILSEFVKMRKSKDSIPAFAGMTECCEVECVWESHDTKRATESHVSERRCVGIHDRSER